MMNILKLSLLASPLIMAIIFLRALLINRLPKITFPVLWALALARLLLPFSIPSPLSLGNILKAGSAALPQALPLTLPQALPSLATGTVPAAAPGLMPVADIPTAVLAAPDIPLPLLLWFIGFAVCALFFLITHRRARRVYQTALPVENALVKNWQAAHPLRRTVRVRQSDELDSPLTYGILRPVILLPKTLDWQDETKLFYILTHEYVHIRRFDALAKWLLALALSAHWFNPLVWLMYMLANRDLELSCDERVLRIWGEGKKSAYALTLLSLEERRSGLTPLCNNFSKNFIEERIVAIMKMKKSSLIAIIASLVLVVGVAMVFATSAAVASGTKVKDTSNWQMDDYPCWPAPPLPKDYRAYMLFVSKGDPTLAVKVTYDGATWEPYDTALEKQNWVWYTYAEYAAEMDGVMQFFVDNPDLPQANKERARVGYTQTLKDIENGIKVSRNKVIWVLDPGPQMPDVRFNPTSTGTVSWTCFGYSFTDKAGNEVDLGLFETRDQLFAALKQYYDAEVAAGGLTQAEADEMYDNVNHSVRRRDEVPLAEKIANYELYQ